MGADPVVAVAAGALTLGVVGAWAGPPRAVRGPEAGVDDVGSAPPAWFVRALGLLELPVDPDAAWVGAIVTGLGLLGWSALRSPAIAVLLLVVLAAAEPAARVVRRRRAGSIVSDAELLEAVAVVQAGVATGSSLERALGRAALRPGAVGQELQRVVTAAASGVALVEALERWSGRHPESGAPLVVDALVIAGSTGADRGRALEAVARALRGREARGREVRALAAQAKLSAAVLVVLPVVFATLVALWDPAVAHFTTGTPAGWLCLLGGVALDAAGAAWMARLIGAVR